MLVRIKVSQKMPGIRGSFLSKLESEVRVHGHTRMQVPTRGNGRCKGPVAGLCSSYWRVSKATQFLSARLLAPNVWGFLSMPVFPLSGFQMGVYNLFLALTT